MSVNRCHNPNCEYFNRTLPSSANVCPMCGTRLDNNVILPSLSPPSAPPPVAPPTPQPIPTPPQPIIQPPSYALPPDETQYQPRVPAVSVESTHPPSKSPTIPVLKLIHSSGREFYLSGEAGYLGRRSQSKPVAPEIDLTGIPHDDIISRHHARVSWDRSQTAYTIVDMSTNGILLNNNLLTSGVAYRLMDGDSLQLGQDSLVVFRVVVKG